MSNDRLRFRVWGVDSQKYKADGLFVIGKNGDLYASHVNTFKVTQPSLIVEQSTGLKDMSGKLVYEGDVVKAKYPSFNGNDVYSTIGLIDWFGWGFILKEKGIISHIRFDLPAVIEVLGNIHENPELMDVK